MPTRDFDGIAGRVGLGLRACAVDTLLQGPVKPQLLRDAPGPKNQG